MVPWHTFWTRSMHIGNGAPEVISRRLQLMAAPWPWPATTVLESQRMVWEKMLAGSQAWWSTWFALWPTLLQPWSATTWRPNQRHTTQWVRTANQALLPYSSTVNANVKRLRRVR
ncbi:hypothetical protein [Caldimonas brevitalea]|uniref:Uncharacterized protein n=1 Tax=Caldimonas brevitalea TaxID=413882 RepID=A0A0G3BGF7_9BURK|nr:hypothetical protein [Caldimonas brevitalea]AKJ28392.1 hypothetical protein AAW51_1701 [Caldimonas brevitalea]